MSDISKILIVDDDPPFVRDLSEVLAAYSQYQVLAATTKGDEIFMLRKEKIAVLVVNLNARRLDALQALSLVSNDYRHVQCIVLLDQKHASVEKSAICPVKDSVFLYIAKPSNLEIIGCAILESLQRLDENDYLPGIAATRVVSFFEVLHKTCRVLVRFGSKKQGFLDFVDGILINAICEKKKGPEAAQEIFDWPPLGFAIAAEEYEVEHTITPSDLKTVRDTARLKREAIDRNPFGPSSPEQKITLFIVDDSRMMRKIIANIFKDDPFVRVVGEAANGEEALELIPQLKPDVVTLDVEMPVMDGLKTIKRLMIQAPTPTVMLSSMTQDGAAVTFDALKYGAVDFVAKPSQRADIDLSEQTKDILNKVHLAAEVELDAVRYVRAMGKDKQIAFPPGTRCSKVVAIGVAEGGYGSLLKLLPHLSGTIPAAYLVMFYAPSKHLDSFVEYMDQFSPLRTVRVKNTMPLEAGVCYFAAGEEYLTLHDQPEGLSLHRASAPFASQRGSINMLFFSVAEVMKENAIAVVLSGMGEDGSEGMAEILRVGGAGVVQDVSGCLYRDMPRAVSQYCPTAKVVPDGSIPEEIQALLAEKR